MIDPDVTIRIDRGCYQSFFFDLIDDTTRLPLNLTGYGLIATFRERGTTPLLLTTPLGDKLFSPDPAGGRVQLIIDEADTVVLPSRDLMHCVCSDTFTCFCQIDGIVSGRRYQLATIAVDNISSTSAGET
jgi:hypothetical protein